MDTFRLKMSFGTFLKSAQSLLGNKNRTLGRLQHGFVKALENKNSVLAVWDQIQLFFAIVNDYIKGNYTAIPKRAIMAVTAGILYFISPLDVVPDFIVGLGFVDDIYIVKLVYEQVEKDLKKYQAWKAAQQNILSK